MGSEIQMINHQHKAHMRGRDEMKCEDCKNMVGEGVSMESPYPSVWCRKGHWEGLGEEPLEDDEGYEDDDPWQECEDFAPSNH